MSIASPCVGFCQIDETSGICVGCARTREEVAIWGKAPPAVLEQIWADLPARRAALGIGLHRLSWAQDDILSFIGKSLRAGGGTWVIGAYGAVAEFCICSDETVDLDLGTTHIVATTTLAAIRFFITAHVRALALPMTVGGTKTEVIVLAVPRAKVEDPRHTGLAALGPDSEAILLRDREERLYDLGIGIGALSFGIRTADPRLVRELEDRIGQPWHDLLASLGRRIMEVSPTRVVRSPVGRIEVFTPIPLPGGRSPLGPHTHFLPAHLAAGLEMPPGLELPEALAPCAVYYPEAGPADSCT